MPKCDFIEIAVWHGCSPVYLLHDFRTFFFYNTSERLLLKVAGCAFIKIRRVRFFLSYFIILKTLEIRKKGEIQKRQTETFPTVP